MGLQLGDRGAKSTFKKRFEKAHAYHARFVNAQHATKHDRASTVAIVDANVTTRLAPPVVTQFGDYVRFLAEQLDHAVQAAAFVVVVWDEPENTTKAKKMEQNRRDALAKAKQPVASDDVDDGVPKDDVYGRDELMRTNCKQIVDVHRLARARMYDEMCIAVLAYMEENYGSGSWSLAFDGVDARGVDRPPNATRKPGVLSNESWWNDVLTRATPIGEGDLKIPDCHQRVFAHAQQPGSPLCDVKLAMIWTTDTDSLIIELLAEAKRVDTLAPDVRNKQQVMLCFREAAQKRKYAESTPVQFLCIDVGALYSAVVQFLFGTLNLCPAAIARRRAAVTFLAIGLAACHSDFSGIKGFHVHHAFDAIRSVLQSHPEILDTMHVSWDESSHQSAMLMLPALELLVKEYGSHLGSIPRMHQARASLRNAHELQLLRVLWTCAYWNQKEHTNVEAFGFFESVAGDPPV